jgi:hypothetical protein
VAVAARDGGASVGMAVLDSAAGEVQAARVRRMTDKKEYLRIDG